MLVFLEEVKENGFKFDKGHVLEELKEGYLTEVYYEDIRIDILLPVLPFFKKVIERGSIFHLSGNELRFAQPEDLIILKLLSGRDKDKEEIEAIKEIHSGLDITYMKNSLKKLVGEEHPSFTTFKGIFSKVS